MFDSVAFKDKVKPDFVRPAEFFVRLRALMLGGFYSLPEGMKDIGYMGNTPGTGDYAGPTPEAAAHIKGVIEAMGLKYTPA